MFTCIMIRVIIILLFPLFLGGLCEKVINNHKYFVPNHQDCGLRSVNSSDIRTLHPWTVAVYTRKSSRSPWQYLVTGTVFSPTAVVTIFGGGFGQPPPGDRRKKYRIPSPRNIMVVGGLITTDLLEADSNTQYAPVSYIAPCTNSSEPNDEDYHVIIIRLAKPFDITSPYVRPICVPFFMRYFFKNFGFVVSHVDVPGIMSGFYSPYGRGFYSEDGKNGPNYASIFVPGISYGGKTCENLVKFYYRSRAEYLFCGVLLPDGLSNYTCMTHGTVGVWESTRTVISFEPSFGPIPRFFVFGILALVPQRDKGLCYLSKTGILTGLRSAYDYIKGHLKCPPTAFPCSFEDRCIPLSSVCNGILDCGNGEDEDPTFCRATSRCDLDNEYQCGLYEKCLEKNRTLDGIQDCPSGSDENPKVSLTLTRRKFTGSARTSCFPLQLSEGVEANCADSLGEEVNCTTYALPGTEITLTCAPYYSPAQRTSLIKRTCYEDRKWKPVRSFSCEPVCGLWGKSLQTGGFIANGQEVEYATRFPWHALIFRETFLGSDDFEYICGGSLIERNIIVTAAHCTVDARGMPLEPQMLKIVMNAPSADFQENGKNEATQIFQVEQIWRPWSFDFRTLHSDIAIVHLKRPATYNNYVRPICYLLDRIERLPALNSTGKVPGFGLTENGELSVDLKYIELNVTKSDDCGLEASPDKFCAKASRSGDTLCYGDSGGGIVFPAKSKRYGAHVLKGVVSNRREGRTRCGQGGSATSFTHVDSFIEWILSTIEGIDTNPDS